MSMFKLLPGSKLFHYDVISCLKLNLKKTSSFLGPTFFYSCHCSIKPMLTMSKRLTRDIINLTIKLLISGLYHHFLANNCEKNV
ncbi:hypothetical protein DERF_011308 [Dermatophagoides farinae]|uniref:Uncharacterized protein n=1 Tax=Dermatophagoides farinae TaxID=6954 RepID=A0A922HWV4_DERFA|nr:hypothetical protein DERF_011308 [Dermatophagoides farinae]